MPALSPRMQIMAGVALATLMAATRGHHFATLQHLPSASWAVFFLAGVYLRPLWALPALFAEAAFLDFAAVTWGGDSGFCVSRAYGFLLPAYGSLWFAGRWYAGRHRDAIATLLPLTCSVLVGSAVCELISSGSFYFLSGRYERTSVAEFGSRLVTYYPRSLSSLMFYVGMAAAVHAMSGAGSVWTALSARFRTSGQP